MFWHGPKLGEVHRACIRSFLRHGHPVSLHCYQAPSDVPTGVDVVDANETMLQSDLLLNKKSGSVALGSDRFRYRLLSRGLGPYVDCDFYCLRPITVSEYMFAFEDDTTINGAILNYPQDSSLSALLIEQTNDEYGVPIGLSKTKRQIQKMRRNLGFPRSAKSLRWGVWGPLLVTEAVKSLGLVDHASAIDIYYPLHPQHARQLLEPGLSLEDLVTSRTVALHLWHNLTRDTQIADGSPLHEIVVSG